MGFSCVVFEIGGWESGTRYCTRVTEQFLGLSLMKQATEGCLMFSVVRVDRILSGVEISRPGRRESLRFVFKRK